MQNFNPQAQGQPTIQRESFLFIEYSTSNGPFVEVYGDIEVNYSIAKIKIDPENVRDNGIGAIVAENVETLVKGGCSILNVYVGSLL